MCLDTHNGYWRESGSCVTRETPYINTFPGYSWRRNLESCIQNTLARVSLRESGCIIRNKKLIFELNNVLDRTASAGRPLPREASPLLSGIALALTIMNNGCTEYQMPWWRGLRRIWRWRRRTVASPISGDHDPITGEPYYRMLPTDDGGESYQMECLLCKAQGNILASRFLHEDNCPLRPAGK